jgi:anhydro-N-acetylmuramic acid kinase
MSGTSLDGIDAALIDFRRAPPWHPVATHSVSYPPALRAEALALSAPGHDELERAALFATAHAELCADAVRALLTEARVDTTAVAAIGYHGQTVRHRPSRGYTVQLASGAVLAEQTGIRVVCDFRSRDVAAGGHGAPLVPAFHAAAFGAPGTHRVIVNLGGMANLTDLPGTGAVTGFDTGPANVLLDLWAHEHLSAPIDHDGAWAATGTVDAELLGRMLAEPYFAKAPPKSTGRELFNRDWLARQAPDRLAPADVQATLVELTAATVADAIQRHCTAATEILLCGGGSQNAVLVRRLAARLPGRKISDTGALGLAPKWVEATAFAWLAREALAARPGNVPEVTGARGPRVLGAIYPA